MINKKLLLLIFCSSLLVLIVGLTSTPSLGDEVSHFRFAKAICVTGQRITYDPLYDSKSPLGYFYNSAPLWHTLLASVWRLFGKMSFPVAQFYHTIYFALLILFTYLLGKELYGQKQGLYSALIVATAPAITAFSVLFYLDVPATSLSVLCLLLIVKREFLLSGVILGLMSFTKRNACFFVPAFFSLVLYLTESGVKKKIKSCLLFLAPAFLPILYDLVWRENNQRSITTTNGNITSRIGGNFNRIIHRLTFFDWNIRTSEYLNSSFLNPVDVAKYFGVVLLITLAIYIIFKLYEKKDIILWLPVICYFLLFCYIFYLGSDIRYLLPVIPLLAILSSKAIVKYFHRKWLIIVLVLLCFVQFSSTLGYVRAKRQIPKGIAEGFTYLQKNTSTNALVVYPEYVILEQANRQFAWAGNIRPVLENLFWNKDEDKVRELLKSNDIDYIAVKKARIYDDSKVHHLGGYPKSFVERLPELSFLKLVFDNKDMSIWQIE